MDMFSILWCCGIRISAQGLHAEFFYLLNISNSIATVPSIYDLESIDTLVSRSQVVFKRNRKIHNRIFATPASHTGSDIKEGGSQIVASWKACRTRRVTRCRTAGTKKCDLPPSCGCGLLNRLQKVLPTIVLGHSC